MRFAKKNKFSAQRTGDFPSKLEASVYQMLLLREKAKEIRNIERQVRIELTDAAIATKIDFRFEEAPEWNRVCCEAKGVSTERWNLLKRLWAYYGPCKLEIWGGNYTRPKIMDIITPKDAA